LSLFWIKKACLFRVSSIFTKINPKSLDRTVYVSSKDLAH
jgi:hypothetical protein